MIGGIGYPVDELDLWAQRWRKRQAQGEMIVIRYADDTVLGFEHREDAEQVLQDLHVRLASLD